MQVIVKNLGEAAYEAELGIAFPSSLSYVGLGQGSDINAPSLVNRWMILTRDGFGEKICLTSSVLAHSSPSTWATHSRASPRTPRRRLPKIRRRRSCTTMRGRRRRQPTQQSSCSASLHPTWSTRLWSGWLLSTTTSQKTFPQVRLWREHHQRACSRRVHLSPLCHCQESWGSPSSSVITVITCMQSTISFFGSLPPRDTHWRCRSRLLEGPLLRLSSMEERWSRCDCVEKHYSWKIIVNFGKNLSWL